MLEPFNSVSLTVEQQFLAAYDAYAKALWRHAYFRVGSREQAEDLVSETFTRAWDHYRGSAVEHLKALLYRILNNLIVDFYRQSRPQVSLDEAVYIPAVTHESGTADVIELQRLRSYLNKLPDHYRQVLVWRYIDDLSAADIAKLSSKSLGSVYVIIHRALKRLRVLAEKRL